ncbi:hypothetical protein [Streptomyces sp. NPDC056468]|uniref:hypothetical protein n=1 Tax=Streptomyces sp. NPDC056468 TaxID=3345830 RepID=UPI0036D0E5D7
MTLTEFAPHTRMPVAVLHERETGWGRKLIAELGVERLDTRGEAIWERTPRALHALVADLAPLVEQQPVRTGAGFRA